MPIIAKVNLDEGQIICPVCKEGVSVMGPGGLYRCNPCAGNVYVNPTGLTPITQPGTIKITIASADQHFIHDYENENGF